MSYTQQKIKHKQKVYKKALSLGFHHLEAALFAAVEDGSGDCLSSVNKGDFLKVLTIWCQTGLADYLHALAMH